jgi:uncharacterized protein YdaU (DUF1376 family)
MSAKNDTWMAFYVGDYTANTLHLTTKQHGAYLLLILAAWKAGGSIPNDDARLAAITKMSAREWKAERDVLREFFDVGDKEWCHGRVIKELAEATHITQERSKAGGIGAAKRWEEHRKRMANASQTDAPSQSQSPSQKKEEESERASRSGSRLPHDWRPSEEDRAFAEQLGKDPDAIAPGFCDYWHGVPGAKGRKADWSATWRNWVRRDVAAATKSSPFARREPPVTMVIDDGQWAARMRGWRQSRFWVYTSDWGPDPEQEGCLVPPHLLRDAA